MVCMKIARWLTLTNDLRGFARLGAATCALLSTELALAAPQPALPPAAHTPAPVSAPARKLLERRVAQARVAALEAKKDIASAHRDGAQAIASGNRELADTATTLSTAAAAWQKRHAQVQQTQAAQNKAKPMKMAELGQFEMDLRTDAPQGDIDVSAVGESARQDLVSAGVYSGDGVARAKDAATSAVTASAELERLAAADKKAKQPADAELAKALATAKEVKKIAADAGQEATTLAREIESFNQRRLAKQAELATLRQRAQAEQQRFDNSFAALTSWVEAHSGAPPTPAVPGNTTPPSSYSAAELKSALPAGTVPMQAKDIAPSFAGYPFDLFNEKSSPVALAIAAIDPEFASDVSGPAEENSALRLPDKRSLLIISGCRTAHECDTSSFVIVYDAANRRAGMVSQTPTANQYVVRGTYDAAVRAVLLNTAHQKLLP